MADSTFRVWPCSVARAMDILSDPWSVLILRDAYHGLTRFEEFRASLGISRTTLARRLRSLVTSGMLTRRSYQTNPPREEYLLTDMGAEFFGVTVALMAWGDRWLDRGKGAPVVLRHRVCGHPIAPRVLCGACGGEVALDDVDFEVGPGFPRTVAPRFDYRSRFARRPQGATVAPRAATA
jgi:DNA-binding HxlR family transcriptional regulator